MMILMAIYDNGESNADIWIYIYILNSITIYDIMIIYDADAVA